MTRLLDTYHGPYLRLYGALAKTGTPKKRSPLLEHEFPCVVCVYHVGQDRISKSPGMCGEALACMFFEWIRFQVDVIAGSGNKACYLATPKAGGCPTYEVSLLQFWINRMIHTATQARLKNYGKAPAVRVNYLLFVQRPILGKKNQRNQHQHLHSWTCQENWECGRLLHAVQLWMGTCKVGIWGRHQRFWWPKPSKPHGLCWKLFVFSQWNMFILWPQHVCDCPNWHWRAQPTSCSPTSFWYELERKTFHWSHFRV